MSELQAYYDAFRRGYWAHEDPELCLCGGSGYALSDVDTWHQCPVHYRGQTHPEDWLMEAGLVLEDGTRACGSCGEFHDVHVSCPAHAPCNECGDGQVYSPADCPKCGVNIRRVLNADPPAVSESVPMREIPPGEEIPF